MTTSNEGTLQGVLSGYLDSGPGTVGGEASDGVTGFIQWCGSERHYGEVGTSETERYVRLASVSDGADADGLRGHIQEFLTFAKKSGAGGKSATRRRKASAKAGDAGAVGGNSGSSTVLTQDGHDRLAEELQELIEQRPAVSAEISRAAADKDVRENSPLEAARERQGMMEARIRQLEAIFSNAIVLDSSQESLPRSVRQIKLGSKIKLKDLGSGRDFTYQLVAAAEANPRDGGLSIESPVGKAIVDRGEGEHVEVVAPRGNLTYLITGIE